MDNDDALSELEHDMEIVKQLFYAWRKSSSLIENPDHCAELCRAISDKARMVVSAAVIGSKHERAFRAKMHSFLRRFEKATLETDFPKRERIVHLAHIDLFVALGALPKRKVVKPRHATSLIYSSDGASPPPSFAEVWAKIGGTQSPGALVVTQRHLTAALARK